MKRLIHTLLLFPFLLPAIANGQQNVAALHQEIQILKQRLAALEARVATQEATIRQLQLHQPPRAAGAPAYTPNQAQAPQQSSGVIGTTASKVKTTGLSFMDRIRGGISYTSLPPSGPWTDPNNWNGLVKGMSPDDVVRLLGKPLYNKSSTRPRADYYWQYAGKLPNGEQLAGRVRFYKERVIDWDLPKF